jgi:DNA-binding winged helix-turn-helix (wHTH) protein
VRICFAECVLDTATRQVLRDGRPVHLTPKAFELLLALLERRPRALSKGDLRGQLWPDTHVLEANLPNVVAEAREAVGDDARQPRFIRTVHGFGYAFCGEAADDAPTADARDQASFRLIWQRREIQLHEGENVLGRDRDAVVWLDSSTVSRRHARIVITGREAVIEDLGSRNGTSVGGRKVEAPTPLADRDELKLGSVVMVFRVFEPSETESGG